MLMTWPKCTHVPEEWMPQTFGRGDNRWWRYEVSQCLHCRRPLVRFAPNFPREARAHTRRHVAWWILDKEGEDGRNTAVLPWERIRDRGRAPPEHAGRAP